MKGFQSLKFSRETCATELKAFKQLLDSKSELAERNDILPFFKNNLHLSAFLGSYNPNISSFDLVAHEYNLFGDFCCDLVVGDSRSHAFAFIEFEDGKSDSIFHSQGLKSTPEWARRFEHGFSQLVDWFWKLDDLKKTDDFRSRFGDGTIRKSGMLALGRKENLGHREIQRLKWRLDKVTIDSDRISCVTLDELYEDLEYKIGTYLALANPAN